MRRLFSSGSAAALFAVLALSVPAAAQPLLKAAIQVDSGNTKLSGATFAYRLTYNCSSTSGPCLGAAVVDLLPAEVQQVSTVPTSPTGDVAAINVTPNYMGTGRTRVQFVMISPLPAGNSGDLLINVRFPNGSTPDGTVATNTADGINLETTPGTFTTPPIEVTAVASTQVTVQKTLTTSPANLDLPETYRLRISVPNVDGALQLTSIGPVTDTLPPGTVFNGATPAADCQPGCVGTTPATVTWTSPCSVPLNPSGNCDVFVNINFPSATFPSGTNVTNSFVADVTPLGEPPSSVGPGEVTHTVTTFVPAPSATLQKNVLGASPDPPTLDQTFSYELVPSNNGNVPLDHLVLIDTLPVELQVLSVTTGAYSNLADFAVGEGVRVSYEKNTALGVFTLWGSSPATSTSTTLTAPPPGLGAGEYLTRLRWEYGQALPGMAATSTANRPRITGRVVSPDNAGGAVAIGDAVQNCVDLSSVYTAGPTNVNRNACRSINVSGPFVQLNPAKDNLSGGGPFNPGQSISYRLRVRSDSRSSDPLPLDHVIATEFLPVDLIFSSWTFDAQGSGLPAPQTFEQIPNFAGTGRTLLRWRWNAGSGDLAINQQVWINITTTVRNGAATGGLTNDFTLEHDAPGLDQRCTGSSQSDALDLDGDSDTAETLCRESETITVAGIAQLIASKTIQGTCDGTSTASSLGTLTGGQIEYRVRVQNVGTVAMQDFVLIDILPFVGDTGVRDTNPRGSLWTPLLAAPITPPVGTVIYYSTSGNPCRGEVGGPTTGCDAPDWSTVPPEPITTTRSFKVEFGDRVVDAFDSLEFQFLLTTPGEVPPGDEAFNSFAYQAFRADGLGALAAEPQKVGVAIGACEAASLGDFVWADLDANGVQDDGPTGLDGVYTRLFSPGADGLAGSQDDVPLAAAVTGTGPGGDPGWYSFPGLAPGSYHVCIEPPPTFVPTAADQGGDDALDSDGHPLTSCSPVVTLGADEDDPTIDFGLVATRLAAVGDHVWIDRDADGVQNESTLDGLNGVTVHLFLDDGDGIAQPGTDPLVGSTLTADDVYGRPGHYLFDGLPGLDYFLQFALPPVALGFTASEAGGDDTVDSDSSTVGGTTALFSLAPDEVDRSFDAGLVMPSGTLALGDQVWLDVDDDGIYEPEDGEVGIDGVRLDLYLDANSDGLPTLGEQIATTTTATVGGFPGRYRFDDLAAGDYVVVVSPSAFLGGGPLSGHLTSTGNDPAPDPDDDVNGDDNGLQLGELGATRPVTLTDNGEPTSEDGNNDTNLTVDLGFVPAGTAPAFDYGDAPESGSGSAPGDYRTTSLDAGPFHRLDAAGPRLGACVDADSGFAQNELASADDDGVFGTTLGPCVGGDDEDGVAFTGPFVPGGTATFSITAGNAACALDAWVDWNADGDFHDVNEQIAAGFAVPVGPPTVLTPGVPVAAPPGVTYARFRCSSIGGLPTTGGAVDGEVEDYVLGIVGEDFGDAPASYGTLGAGAASHTIDPLDTLRLGACVDTETDGQPSIGADGDDLGLGSSRVGDCIDDEDGVVFTAPLVACQASQVVVSVTPSTGGPGRLDAWIDFDGNGDFGGVGEQTFANQLLGTGANALGFMVPCTAVEGTTYARFRLSSAGSLDATGTADDGEVEDHAVITGVVDFGDAPDSYATTLGNSGPHHRVVTGFSLGATVDGEPAGQPSLLADGDGADEDGVVLPGSPLLACSTVNLSVSLTNTAAIATPRLDAWIDFDGDGGFDDPRDRIATSLALASGANPIAVNVPCDALPAISYARFRLSSIGVAGPGGVAADGEVEDYRLVIAGLDFGDAPDPTYPTLLASDGARHAVSPGLDPTLGGLVDTEADGQPSAGLTGDDGGGVDDEDGVTFPDELVPGIDGRLVLTTGATGGMVSCWIDFDRDGDWADAGEAVVGDAVMAASVSQGFSFAVPIGSPQGTAASRCRIASVGGLGVSGFAADGEVEDHPAPIGVETPRIGIAKQVTSITRLPTPSSFTVVFELRFVNLGNVPLSDLGASVDFAAVFTSPASFSAVVATSGDLTVEPSFDGATVTQVLAPGNGLAVGAEAVLTISVAVDSGGEAGPYVCSTLANGTSPSGVPVSDVSQDGPDPDPDVDGDATDDDEPTAVVLPVEVLVIPTLDLLGLGMLVLLLGFAAFRALPRLAGSPRRGV